MTIPTILTIAGSDSSGGAGIQADLKAIAANGGYGASVITAITAQNTRGVIAAETVSSDLIRAQIDAVFDDLTVVAAKSGMLASQEVIRTVAEGLQRHRPRHYVCDPVMISKTGFPLLPEDCLATLRRELLPLATLVTPNVHEAEALSGLTVETLEQAEQAGRKILEQGAQAVLVKGGHLKDGAASDILVTTGGSHIFRAEWVDSRHTHGTGCSYSASIATHLARGLPLIDAIGLSKEFMTEAIRHGLPVGGGTGPTDPFFFLRREKDGARWLRRLQGGT
jgi:hydroxymethylpyrimidine/phosphomethylpyrimidine kinase